MFSLKSHITFAIWDAFFLCLGCINLAYGGSSFSSAIKNFQYKELGEEVVLYEKKFGYFGHITEQWFTGTPFDRNATIRMYIDGEDSPSIECLLHQWHSLAPDPKAEMANTPWSTRMFGHLAANGAVFNTFRIPFMTGIKITMQNNATKGVLWYTVRGLLGFAITFGSVRIPVASRLQVYEQSQLVKPLEFITLSKSANKSGFLFMVNFDAQSASPSFLEGCMRAKIDGTLNFLSSGTEDFFLSAYYFNRGGYHGYQSGLTYKSQNIHGTHIIAYKFFVDDPVIFSESFELIWRNFEIAGGPDGCPTQFKPDPSPKVKFPWPGADNTAPVYLRSYVWVYEWSPRESLQSKNHNVLE